MKRVFLSGEGPHELGGWADLPSYRDTTKYGVLEALLRRCHPDGWEVIDARLWKSVPMFRAGAGMGGAEARKVRQLAVLARHAGCDVLAFTRDADKDKARIAEIESAIAKIHAEIPELLVIGGCAVNAIEAWCLALLGERDTEALRQPHEKLGAMGYHTREDFLGIIERTRLDAIPDDARSLRSWLQRAKEVLDP